MSILSAGSKDCFSLFRRSMIQSKDLPLTEILDDAFVKDVFSEEKVDFGNAYEDVFTPAITLWAMISQFLFSETGRSVKAAAGRVVSLYASVEGRVIAQNAGNYCRAKQKIPASAIKRLTCSLASRAELAMNRFDDLGVPLEADQCEDRMSPRVITGIRSMPIKGRYISVDGFMVDAPDTSENQKKYPQNPVQEEGLGFPIMRCVTLISMTTGLLIDLAMAPYSGKETGETALLRRMKSSLRTGDVLTADCYYCTYWLVAMCILMGVEIVMKNHHKREDHPEGAKILSESERIVTWDRPQRPKWMSKREYRKIPKTLPIRLVDVTPVSPGARCEGFTVATTILEPESANESWIGALYEGRWQIEPDIRSIKCTINLEHLRSQTPEGIERELWTGLLTHNLVRFKMLQSGSAANRDLRSMSFTESYQLLSTNWLLCACVGVTEPMATASQGQGVCAIVGQRPDRIEPRENKRRPKTIKLMTVPRRIFHAMIGTLSRAG